MNDLELLRALCDPDRVTMIDTEVVMEIGGEWSDHSSPSPSSAVTGEMERPRKPRLAGSGANPRPAVDTDGGVEWDNPSPKITLYSRETTGDKNQTGLAIPMYPRLSGAFRGSTASILRRNRSILTASS